MLSWLLLLLFLSVNATEENWEHMDDAEDLQCTDNTCIKLEEEAQTFGFAREIINDEECRRVKKACIKLRKCQDHCTLDVREGGGTHAHVNPCRLVVPLCQGINLREYLDMRQFKDSDPFMI